EERVNPSAEYYDAFPERDAKVRAHREASRSYDLSRLRGMKWLREQLSQGTFMALFWDPEKKKNQQISRHRWASMGDLDTMGVFDTGIAIVKGVRRTVFFNSNDFETALSGIAESTTKDAPRAADKGGRPTDYAWKAVEPLVLRELVAHGRPHKNNPRLPSKAQLVELVKAELSDKFDEHPSDTAVKYHVNRWIAEFD